jgi:hypothetical protein
VRGGVTALSRQHAGVDTGQRVKEIRERYRDTSVARARTLAVLRSLNGNRKGEVVKSLHDTYLIGKLGEEQVMNQSQDS